MIFLVVGTLFPFDRLVMAVDNAVAENLIEEDVIAQVGKGGVKCQNIKCVEFLDKVEFDEHVRNASCLISHAGMGNINMALTNNKPLLVMPRLSKYKEHVNDHQLDTARKFEKLGHLLVAYTVDQLPDKIKQLKTFVPKKRQSQPDLVAARITEFLETIKKED